MCTYHFVKIRCDHRSLFATQLTKHFIKSIVLCRSY